MRNLVKEVNQEVLSFADISFSDKEQSLKTAMSFGLAASDGKTSFSDLLERAESACQSAKNAGDGMSGRVVGSRRAQRFDYPVRTMPKLRRIVSPTESAESV